MTIAAEKINQTAFEDIYELMEDHVWLRTTRSALLKLWNMCDEREQQKLLKDLFGRFTFIDSSELKKISRLVVEKITKGWGFQPGNTYIAAIAEENEVDGSIGGIQYLKNKFHSFDGWKEDYFYSSIGVAANTIRTNDNLILFDDFIGSGKTLVNKITYLQKTLRERKIKLNSLKVVAFAGMQHGISEISNTFRNDLEVYSVILLKKGISDYEKQSEIEVKKELMIKLEKKLGEKFKKLKLKDHHLGYKMSETLFQIDDYNCPNNLFPVFWWPIMADNTRNETLFNRIR